MLKLAQIFGWVHFFHKAIESQALHEASERELLQKSSNTLDRLKIQIQVRHQQGKICQNLSSHQPAKGLGGSVFASIIGALQARICIAGFRLYKAEIREKSSILKKSVVVQSSLKQYQYSDISYIFRCTRMTLRYVKEALLRFDLEHMSNITEKNDFIIYQNLVISIIFYQKCYLKLFAINV